MWGKIHGQAEAWQHDKRYRAGKIQGQAEAWPHDKRDIVRGRSCGKTVQNVLDERLCALRYIRAMKMTSTAAAIPKISSGACEML